MYYTKSLRSTNDWNIVAAFWGMHMSPVKHSYVWLTRKCDYRTDRWMDRQTTEEVIPMCRYASQVTQKAGNELKFDLLLPLILSERDMARQICAMTSHLPWCKKVQSIAAKHDYETWSLDVAHEDLSSAHVTTLDHSCFSICHVDYIRYNTRVVRR